MFGESLILWKSSRQGAVSVSTAESELIEIMNGACSGDAVRVVIEEALNMKIIATSFSDSTSALSVVTADTGTWRTRHLRKGASALRARVISGDWLVKHLPGSEMPAGLGTKTLSVEKFNQLRILLGMCPAPKEDKRSSGSTRGGNTTGVTSEAAVKALRAVILAAKLAQAKAEEGPIEVYKVPLSVAKIEKIQDGGYLIVVCLVVLVIGIVCGCLLSDSFRSFEIQEGNLGRPAFLASEELRTQRSTTNGGQLSGSATTGQNHHSTQVGTLKKRGKQPASASRAIPAGSNAANATPAGSSAANATPAGSSAANAIPAESSSAANATPAGSSSAAKAIPAGSSSAANAIPPGSSSAANAIPAGSSSAANAIPAGSSSAANVTPAGSSAAYAIPAGSFSAAHVIPAGSSVPAGQPAANVRGAQIHGIPGRAGGSPMYISKTGEKVLPWSSVGTVMVFERPAKFLRFSTAMDVFQGDISLNPRCSPRDKAMACTSRLNTFERLVEMTQFANSHLGRFVLCALEGLGDRRA